MFTSHAFTAMKVQGHMGLQELITLTTSVKDFLGPVKFYKFIFDQSSHESILTCSSFRLLESLDLNSAVGQLLNETIQAHHKIYKTGTTTLFFLVGAWSSAVLECLHQGAPVSLIVSVMLEGLNTCIEQVQALQIPINNVVLNNDCTNKRTAVSNHKGCSFPFNNGDSSSKCENHTVSLAADDRSISECPASFSKHVMNIQHQTGELLLKAQTCQKGLFHSRHFSVPKSRSYQDQSKMFKAVSSDSCYLGDLTKALSHGTQEVLHFVEKAINQFCENASEISVTKNHFCVSQLDTCCLPGVPEVNSNDYFGYTTLVSPENATVTKNLEGKSLQILLLDGELTECHRHMGFNYPTNIKTMSESISIDKSKSDNSWISRVYRAIIQANIDLILVRGDACPILMRQCIHRNILIVTYVKQNVLQAFSKSTGAEPVTYFTQINDCCIGSGVYVSLCTRGSSVVEVGHKIAINIKAKKINLITVMLCTTLAPKMQITEDQFWTCAYRLHHALHDQKVFYGGGAVELLCLYHLQKLEEGVAKQEHLDGKGPFHCTSSWMATTARFYKTTIFRCLAKGWYKYLSVLLCNTGEYFSELDAMTFIQNELQNISHNSSPSEYILKEYTKKVLFFDGSGLPITQGSIPVYDNVIPKLEAWRRALHLVLIVLQTDAEVITCPSAQKQMLKKDNSNGEYLFL
ncbi:chaperonin-containing T-complex member BBS12 [Rhinophrynus dorsalis]